MQHSENNELEQAFMRGVSVVIEGAPMSDMDRRSPTLDAEAFGAETSPRILRLRALFARLTGIYEAPADTFTDADLNAVCDEIYEIGDQVWASPVQDWTDIVERALVSHCWFRDEETKSPDILAARGLVSAVLAYNPTA